VEFVNVKPGGTHNNHWHLKRVISKVTGTMSNIKEKISKFIHIPYSKPVHKIYSTNAQ